MDDADSLADEKSPAKTVATQVRALVDFYAGVAAKGLGVVMYTE